MKHLLPLICLLVPFLSNAEVLKVQGSISPAVSEGTRVTAGQKFETKADSKLYISPVNGLILSIGANTRLEILSINTTPGQEAATVFLNHGTIYTQITSKVDFKIQTPKQSIQAMGTAWTTNYDSQSGISKILVSDSSITIKATKGTFALTKGEIGFTNQSGEVSIYKKISDIPKNQRKDFLVLIAEARKIIQTAQAAQVLPAGNPLRPFDIAGTPVEININEPVVSGF